MKTALIFSVCYRLSDSDNAVFIIFGNSYCVCHLRQTCVHLHKCKHPPKKKCSGHGGLIWLICLAYDTRLHVYLVWIILYFAWYNDSAKGYLNQPLSGMTKSPTPYLRVAWWYTETFDKIVVQNDSLRLSITVYGVFLCCVHPRVFGFICVMICGSRNLVVPLNWTLISITAKCEMQ